jgi:AraC-like DNA-binding protein
MFNGKITLELDHLPITPYMKQIILESIDSLELSDETTTLFQDRLEMCYLIIPLNIDEKVIVGPFLKHTFKRDSIPYLSYQMGLSKANTEIIENSFTDLPIYNDDEINGINEIICSYFKVASKKNDIHSISISNKQIRELDLDDVIEFDFVYMNNEQENLVQNCIFNGDVNQLKEYIKLSYHLIIIPSRYKHDVLRDKKNLAITLNSISVRTMLRAGINPHLAHSISNKYGIEIERQTNVDDINKLSGELVMEYCKCVQTNKSSSFTPLVNSAILYIHKHPFDFMSLSSIAGHLSVSKEHLSRVFKKETSLTITEYIHHYKIKESLKFLCTIDHNISQVASVFSYSSASHYSKIFTDVMGVSPKEYKTISDPKK